MELDSRGVCFFQLAHSYNIYSEQCASDFEYINSTTNVNHTLRKTDDLFKISGFLIPSNYNLADIDHISIHINGSPIWNFPFYIITNFSNIVTDDFYHIVKLHTNIFTKKNIGIPVFENNVDILITSSFDFQFKFIFDMIYLPPKVKNNMIDKTCMSDILQFSECAVKNEKYVDLLNYTSSYTGYCGGFYLRSNSIPNGYTIHFDASSMWTPRNVFRYVDKYEIMFKSQIIRKWNVSDEIYKILCVKFPIEIVETIIKYVGNELMLLWIPLFSDAKHTNYDGQIITHNGMRIKIEFANDFHGKIYYPRHNKLLYDDKMCVVRYSC